MNFSMDNGTAVILPGSGGALSDEVTLTDSPGGGVIIEDIQKDSPVARTGTLKKGDQLNAVTIHFDNLKSEEVGKILKYTEPYKTSLKLNAKGELTSPGYGYKTSYMGSGDQTYLKLYNSKIKPHLKLAKTSTDVGGLAIKGKTPSIDINGPKISSDFDLNQKTSPTIDVKTPKIGGGLTTSDINIKSPKGAIKMPDMELKGPGFEMPSKSLKTDINTPGFEIKSPKGGFDVKMANRELQAPKFEMPSSNLHGPNISSFDTNLNLQAPKVKDVDLNLSTPNIDLDAPNIQTPNVDISSPKIDDIGTEGKIKFPKFKKPTFSLSGNKPKGPELDVSMPDMKADIRSPDVDLKGGVDLPETKGKWKIPSLQMPSFGLNGPRGPDVDFDGSVRAPSVDGSGPNLKGNFGTPDIDMKLPKGDMDANLPDAGVKFKLPGEKWPSNKLSLSGPDTGVNLPKGQIDLSAPDIQGDMKGPNLDLKDPNIDINAPNIEVPGTKGKFKMPSLNMPSFGFSGPRGPDVDFDGSVKAPGVDVSGPNLKGNLETPDIDLKLPKGDIDANLPDTGGKFKLSGVKWPNNKLSLSGPDTGVNLPKGQINLSAPDFQGDMKGPNLDLKGPNIDINTPNVDVPGAKGKIKMPDLKMPSFALSGSKGPDVDFDGSVKAPGVDVSAPNHKGNFETPDVDLNLPKGNIDINTPRAEINKPKFKMPKFNVPSELLSTPDTSLNLKAPTLSGDMDAKVNVPKLKKPNLKISGIEGPDVNLGGKIPDVNISSPDLKAGIRSAGIGFKKPKIGEDYDMPDMNLEVPEVKLKGPGLKKPSLNMPAGNVSGPDVDLNLSAPNVDLSAPNIKGDFKGPNIDINAPKVGGFGGEGKFKFPKFKKPTFSLSGNKPKGPKMDVSMPDVKADIRSPDVDLKGGVDLPETKGKWKIPSLQMPSFGLNGPRGPDVDFDGSVKAPDVDVSGPNLKGNFGTPDIDLKLPKGDIDANLPDTGGKFKLPGVKWPSNKLSLSGPDTGVNLPKGQINLSAPDFQGDMKGPNVDLKGPNIDINAPNVDVPVTKGKFNMPSLKMPSFGFSGPRGPDVDFDGSVKAPDVDVSGPNLKGNFGTPDIDLKLPKGDIDANLPDTGGKFKLPGVKWPSNKLSLSGPDTGVNLPKGQINLSAPDFKGDMKGPNVDLKGPNIDINAPNVDVPVTKGKFNMPSLKMPSFGFSGPRGPDVDFDGSVKAPDVDVSGPNLKGNFGTPDIDLKLPKGDIDANLPDTGGKFKLPGVKWPSNKLSLSGPDTGVNLPKGQINLSAPDFKGDMKGPNVDLKGPNIDINAPNVDVPVTKGKFNMPSLKMPSFGFSGPRGPDVDFDGSVKAPDVDVSGPNLKGNFGTPDIDLKLPKGDIDANLPDTGGKFKLPGVKWPSNKLSLSGPDTGVNLPKGQINLSAPDFQGDMKGPNLDLKGPNIDINAPNVDVPVTKGKFNMPSLKVPSFGFSGPRGPDVDFDGSVKAPGVDVSGPNLKGNFKTPDVDLNLPKVDVDINTPKAEINKPKFKMPKFNMPSANLLTPDTDFNLKAPTVSGGLDAKLNGPKLKKPNLKISGIEGPDVNLGGRIPDVDISPQDLKTGTGSAGIGFKKPKIGADYDTPDMNLEVPEVKLKGPGLKKPSLSMPAGNVSGPDMNLNLSAPNIKGDFKGPNIDINAPNVDGFGGEGKLKFPKFKKPTFSLFGNKPKGPELDVSMPDVKADIRSPDVDLKGGVDLPETKGKWKIPSLQMPSFGLNGPRGPDVDFDGSVKAPDVDVSGPNLKGNFGTPDIDLKLPKGDIDANLPDTGGKFKLPGVKWPSNKLSLSGPDTGVNLPKGQINLSAPDFQGDMKGPNVDLKGPNIDINAPNVDVPVTKGKFKMPSLKIPSFGFSGPRGPDMDFDGSVKAPGVDVSGPNLKGNFGTPDIDLKLPKGDIDANLPDTGGTFKLPGVKLPSNKLSLSGPDTGVNLPKGQINLSAPDFKGDMKGPNLDLKGPNIDINAPNVDVPVTKGKFNMPSLKVPSFGLSRPDTDVSGSVKVPSVDVSGPNIKGNYDSPDFGMQVPNGNMNIRTPQVDLNKQHFATPSLNIPGSKWSSPDAKFGLKTPTSDVYAKLKVPKFKNPNLEFSGIEGPSINVDGNVKVPKADITAAPLKAGVDLKKPKAGVDFDMPVMDLDVPDISAKGPDLKKPSLNVSSGNVDLNLPTSNIRGGAGVDIPDALFKGKKVKGENIGVKDTKFSVSSPNLNGEFREVGVDVSPINPSAQLNVSKLKFNTDENVNMQNKFSRDTFKLRSASVSDLDDGTAQGKYDANLQGKSSSTININDTSMNKKGKFKFSKFFTFNHKSKGSVDFTKAKATNSSGTFTSKHPFPELEFSVSKD